MSALRASVGRLVDDYDLLMFDLDGVVYIGDEAVRGAVDHLRRVRAEGAHVAFITNNASRSPEAVVAKLIALGVEADVSDVVTSAQAAAHLLVVDHGAGARIAVLGGPGLETALVEAGLEPVAVDDEDAVAIVSGYGPDVVWRDVMRAAVRIRDGLPWVASNTDLTLPTAAGPAPGHGVLVDLLSRFAGVAPVVAGKPRRPLLDETIRRVGGDRPLMVGDRLDTDITGGHEAGVDSLLVMTGVTRLPELVAAMPEERPTYLASSLQGLLEQHPAPPRGHAGCAELGGWRASVHDGRLRVDGEGAPDDWWRVAAVAAWEHLDEHGNAPDTRGLVPPTGNPAR
ncbi:HAD-IIA family hydrolase [Nocardioides sp.]|uniref:HAD-IIA family hydrolase n=1 Tax=Nocardioides sp. TaxID=35761 RepID=UPI002ED1135C